jgi:hypothetical protein
VSEPPPWTYAAQVVTFRLVADLTDVVRGGELVASSIGPAGEAVLLCRYRNQARLVAVDHGGRRLGELTTLWPERIKAPVPSRLLDGRMLIVGKGARHLSDGSYEPNVIVYAKAGTVLNEFLVGDGIEDVQVTSDGHLWVSYFDEGVFGNPLASSGLREFDASGQMLWAFAPPEGFDRIEDCYALNAAAPDHVYAYYYSSFPIVQIGPGHQTRGWHTDVSGARALAVDGERVLLFGGYAGERTRALIGALDGSGLADARNLPTSVIGPDALESIRISGRGPVLHGFAGARWYQFDMSSVT